MGDVKFCLAHINKFFYGKYTVSNSIKSDKRNTCEEYSSKKLQKAKHIFRKCFVK